MIDRQIIIDGVDVSWCEHYTGNIGYLIDKNWTCRAKIQGTKCEDWPNCYFKNWRRKEQECEELKEWKEKVVNLFNKTCRCKYLNEENAYCSFYNKKCIGAINKCLYKNQQALTEIKEITEICCKTTDCKKCKFFEICENNCVDVILQKISECEGNDD